MTTVVGGNLLLEDSSALVDRVDGRMPEDSLSDDPTVAVWEVAYMAHPKGDLRPARVCRSDLRCAVGDPVRSGGANVGTAFG